ncbi:hypothetical protein E6O75_ATG11228 [Venturia nashicola]|uniref:Uncharacterized protein n=1 Tax=Venturia nashicola TaxID=86259 RepID=A0A4Z1PKN2_9PEZI|nr:hypothetical protein E6O75_ATG11228 [Venturia nashicola]
MAINVPNREIKPSNYTPYGLAGVSDLVTNFALRRVLYIAVTQIMMMKATITGCFSIHRDRNGIAAAIPSAL